MVVTETNDIYICMKWNVKKVKKSRTIQCALIKCTQSIFINESLWTGFIELSVDYNLKQMLWANGENGISKSGWCSRQIRVDIFCNSFFIGKFIPPESMTALCASLFFRSLVCKYILLSLYRNIGRLSRTILWRRRLNFILFVDAAAQFFVFLLKIEMSQSGNKKVNHAESNEMKWNEMKEEEEKLSARTNRLMHYTKYGKNDVLETSSILNEHKSIVNNC